MYIHLPIFDFPLVFNEKEYNYPDSINLRQVNSSLLRVFDSELDRGMTMETPVETKHRRLGRSHRTGLLDRELKPNAKIRDELNDILRYPPTKYLSDLEKDLIWKFRFYLTRDKKGAVYLLLALFLQDLSSLFSIDQILKMCNLE
jgi:phosphatidylinositol 3-kinase